MANQAEGTNIIEIAFSSSFDYRDDVVRIPERTARDALQPPTLQKFLPFGPA